MRFCTTVHSQEEAETAAFGYLRERLVLNSGSLGTFGYSRLAPCLSTASDGLLV
jgi:hypothetical protein